MKRLIIIVFLILMLLGAHAQEEADMFACRCGEEKCVCFLQEGDIGPATEGVIRLLKDRGYLAALHSRGVFDEEVTLAVKAFQKDSDLEETGMLDNDTLTMLIFGELPGAGVFEAEGEWVQLWIPTDGGICRHEDPTCCNIKNPRIISERNAAALMMEACEICMPGQKENWP